MAEVVSELSHLTGSADVAGVPKNRIAPALRRIAHRRITRNKLNLGIALAAISGLVLAASILIFKQARMRVLNPEMTSRLLRVPFSDIGLPSLSQDGNWVALPALGTDGVWGVYFVNSSGGEPRRVASDSMEIVGVDISPNGSQIVYDRLGTYEGYVREICVVPSLGGLSKKIVNWGGGPRWRPDGQRIGYVRFDRSTMKPEYWSVKPDGSDPRLESVDELSGIETLGRLAFALTGQKARRLRDVRF